MRSIHFVFFLFIVLLFLQGCNTLYSTRVMNIEIAEPGEVKFPGGMNKVAVRYNNCNIATNPFFSNYFINNMVLTDSTNLDSVASEIYYQQFVEELNRHNFFDSIIEVAPYDYSQVKIVDTITYDTTSLFNSNENSELLNVFLFSRHISKYPMEKNDSATLKYLHPQLGLYQNSELQTIADTTNADLLISFDYFSSLDGTYYDKTLAPAIEFVLTQAYWNFYDLHQQKYLYSYHRADTITWQEHINEWGKKEFLPSTHDAVLNAADISGTKFADYLIPHWVTVQRMYYTSNHVEFKKTMPLIEDGKWLEAIKIWKANLNNPNKSIVAKCKFNMALACEMQGNLDAALEWAVESYHVLGQKNPVHAKNCMDYIKIISQRRMDKRLLDKQYGLVD